MLFENVRNSKYLGVGINSQADCHGEIHRIITAGNKCYLSVAQLFKLKKLFWPKTTI